MDNNMKFMVKTHLITSGQLVYLGVYDRAITFFFNNNKSELLPVTNFSNTEKRVKCNQSHIIKL